MERVHQISTESGYLPNSQRPSDPFEAARKAAGTNNAFAHLVWQEKELQMAYFDWVVTSDISFRDATSLATRGILTWNRLQLLAALPASHGTISAYIMSALEPRRIKISRLLQAASSKINLSVNIWTSPNHL